MSAESERVDGAIAHMILHRPWWASLLLNLRRHFTASVPMMATDGTWLYINETFTATLSVTEIEAVLAHEVAHCALLHPFRRGARKPLKWNIACDQAVNALLEADGITLPQGCIPAGPLDKTAEELYDRVKMHKLSMADLMDAGSLGEKDLVIERAMTSNDWRQAVASMRAIEPKGIHRSLQEAGQPKRNWRAELALWASATIKSADRTWSRPSRRYSPAPGCRRDPQTKIALCVDTSGSVDDNLLSIFLSEMRGICATNGVEAYIIACDAAVHAIYSPGEEWASLPGGGGTDFRPAIQKSEEIQVDGIVYMTDGAGEYGPESALPTIWAMSTSTRAPWGHTIHIGE